MYSKTQEVSKLIRCLELKSELYFLEELKKVVSVKNKKSEVSKLSYWKKKPYPILTIWNFLLV